MGNKNIKKSKGRPKFEPNVKQLKDLYKQVADKTISNEEGWKIAHCGKTKWYELKKLYSNLEAKI